jgi:Xaa-Pro aminopeptidase
VYDTKVRSKEIIQELHLLLIYSSSSPRHHVTTRHHLNTKIFTVESVYDSKVRSEEIIQEQKLIKSSSELDLMHESAKIAGESFAKVKEDMRI